MAFNADKFMAGTSAPMSTTRLVCPEGEWRAFIDDGDKAIEFKSFPGKDGKPDSHQCVVLWAITGDQQPNQFLKRDKVLVPQTIWLDVKNDELDMSDGANVGLGRLRRMFNQNEPGQAWAPSMLKGKGPAMIKTGQRSNPNNPEDKFAEVLRVAPITT